MAAKKRPYSMEFPASTKRRVQYNLNHVPPELLKRVKGRAKREGVSLRNVILRLLTDWVER